MIVIRILALIAGLLIVSAGMGIVPAVKICGNGRKQLGAWAFVCGLVCMWGLFQIVSIPFILKEQFFFRLVWVYAAVIGLWILGSVIFFIVNKKNGLHVVAQKQPIKTGEKVLWGIVLALLLLQLFMAVFLAYADGDDAYYIGIASVTESGNTMYRVIPYTGQTTELDIRHGLAPFPLWIAFLSRVSGCSVATVAHVVLPVVFISITYLIYGLLGSRIIKERKWLPVFLIFVEVLVLWGNYSFLTAETFLLTRSRQGKAAIANIVIPFLVLLLFVIGEKLQEKKKIGVSLWLMLAAGVTASCLCTTLGSFFSCVLVGISGVCMAVSYKKYKMLIPMCLCCIPAILYLGLFLVLR